MIYNMRGDTYHAGPVLLSDVYTQSVGHAKDGIAASQGALYDAYNSLNSSISNLNSKISKSYPNTTLYKAGHVITINITEPSSVTHTKGQWNTLFTLDPIFRPSEVLNFVIINNKTNIASNSIVNCRISTSGYVMIWPYTDESQVYGTVTYVV